MTQPTAPLTERELWTLADLRAAGVGSRTTVWRLQRDDPTFPQPVEIRPGMKRWIPAEIRAWLAARPRAGQAA